MLVEGLVVLIIVLLVICVFSVYYAVKFGLVILQLEDIIEESIDNLDNSYNKLSSILEIPIFFDSVEVRQCVDEIKNARNSILLIGNSLTSINHKEYEEQEVDKKSDSKEKI
jgi:hypothetical protein